MKKIIHVNRHIIALNAKDGGNRPVYTIKSSGKTWYARSVRINGPSELIYNGSQLSCGARAWIETSSPIEMIDQMSYKQVKNLVDAK